jgi:hypothetical protein
MAANRQNFVLGRLDQGKHARCVEEIQQAVVAARAPVGGGKFVHQDEGGCEDREYLLFEVLVADGTFATKNDDDVVLSAAPGNQTLVAAREQIVDEPEAGFEALCRLDDFLSHADGTEFFRAPF